MDREKEQFEAGGLGEKVQILYSIFGRDESTK